VRVVRCVQREAFRINPEKAFIRGFRVPNHRCIRRQRNVDGGDGGLCNA
jgi:hypothetical protein